MSKWAVKTKADAFKLIAHVAGLPFPFFVTVAKGEPPRTTQMNSTLHMWFGQIAKHYGDRDAVQVKGECHHRWGLAIKRRDTQWAWVWDRSCGALDYEKQCKALASGVFQVSSSMSVKELGEYMDALFRHYTAEGVRLTDPEARKHEEAA